MYPHQAYRSVEFSPSSFWKERRDVVRKTTLRHQLDMLKSTGRYDAFKLKWHPIYDEAPAVWPVPKHLFWDSDVAKWIEGACYFLHEQDDKEIDQAVRELVDMIGSAQQPDGYLNIHYTVVAPGLRFTNLRDMHELYNAGHLIEAALSHQQHYKNDLLLQPLEKYVELLRKVFGPEEQQKHGYPGHPEIEWALLRLYEQTGNAHHFDLAKYFIEERGNPKGQDGEHYYVAEAKSRGEREYEMPRHYDGSRSFWYQQAHAPIHEQKTVEGHSVRAMYLLTAVAELIRMDPTLSAKYEQPLETLWTNMVDKKMYLTGGIGAIEKWEGFGIDYFLPQSSDEGGCYAETCAGIGVVMLAERLLQNDLDSRYSDIMELCLYNAVLTAMSGDGKAFTYVNQLGSSDQNLSKREEWFECACCPPNITRMLGVLGGYFYAYGSDGDAAAFINVHQYTSADLRFKVHDNDVHLSQETKYPFDGAMTFKLSAPEALKITIRLRIPGWATKWEIKPPISDASLKKGYLTLPSTYLLQHPSFTLSLHPMTPRLISPHPFTAQSITAIARGPLIYCAEDIDNPWVKDHFRTTLFDTSTPLVESSVTDAATGESYTTITASGGAAFQDVSAFKQNPGSFPGREAAVVGPSVVQTAQGAELRETLTFIPYYFRSNRGGTGQMRVGFKELRPSHAAQSQSGGAVNESGEHRTAAPSTSTWQRIGELVLGNA